MSSLKSKIGASAGFIKVNFYITKQLVEKSNGKISVKSQSSGGTEFLLQFPRKE